MTLQGDGQEKAWDREEATVSAKLVMSCFLKGVFLVTSCFLECVFPLLSLIFETQRALFGTLAGK